MKEVSHKNKNVKVSSSKKLVFDIMFPDYYAVLNPCNKILTAGIIERKHGDFYKPIFRDKISHFQRHPWLWFGL